MFSKREFPVALAVIGITIDHGARDTGIPDSFSIPKSQDYERPNSGISVITCEMHALITK